MAGSEAIWDGNGGSLDPAKATQRDMLVALHVKMDQVVIPQLKELTDWRRELENGAMSKGQEAAVLTLVQGEKDQKVNRRSARTPVWALLVASLALITSIIYTAAAVHGGAL